MGSQETVKGRHHIFTFLLLCLLLRLSTAEQAWNQEGNASLPLAEPMEFSLFRRLEDGRCDENTPCADKSCCNKDSAAETKTTVIQQFVLPIAMPNRNAVIMPNRATNFAPSTCVAEVGGIAAQRGYDFCSTEKDPPCKNNCAQPPSTGLNTGNITNIVIGYYESWASYRRGACPQRKPNWIRADSITHLYVAFAYIKPDTYEVYPMEGTGEDIFRDIVDIKRNAPGLKVYASIGGWTFSDNGTITDADSSATHRPCGERWQAAPQERQKFINQLVNFMSNFGFDGVDLDWEYPGAPDRGGQDRDVDNFTSLIRDIREWFTAQSNGWGLSLTIPTSYWYMRWFDVEQLVKHVDWINLMTYDLHGSWDSPEDQIGSFVYAHTNLTEIKDALNLLWRNNVPANKAPIAPEPGCPFSSGGDAGACTGESGILSYDEINAIYETYHVDLHHDEEAAVMYFAWGSDPPQWVSYDNVQTIRDKVQFANEQGLLGLFIWSLDLDTDDAELLNAVLNDRGGLGSFREQNGVGPEDLTDWQPATGACYLSECDAFPTCDGAYKSVGLAINCDEEAGAGMQQRWVCCPRDNAPAASTCSWVSSFQSSLGGALQADCVLDCQGDQVAIAESKWYTEDDGEQKRCLSGYARYCCDTSETVQTACSMLKDECYSIGGDGKPDKGDPCARAGKKFMTYAQDTCQSGSGKVWCCDEVFDSSVSGGPVPPEPSKPGRLQKGAGKDCQYSYWTPGYGLSGPTAKPRALCCGGDAQVIYKKRSPVPLAWLFPDPVPEDADISYDLDIQADAFADEDPNDNGFGWVIMTGPEDQLTSLDRRDGSHWELFDCPGRETLVEDDRVTVRAVCVDDSPDSNCGDLFLGREIAGTVVEMPPDCGIGRHAMAVSMESATDQRLPARLHRKLAKRGETINLRSTPHVYNFTFDYDFSVLHGRADSDVQVRIDYSDEPGYWKAIVNNDPQRDPLSNLRRRREETERIVETEHGGSWKRYAHHSFRAEKRELAQARIQKRDDHEERHHAFHKRWFPAEDDWDVLSAIDDIKFETPVASRHIQETFPFWIFNEHLSCKLANIPYTAYFAVWADLSVDIKTSAILTVIGKLSDPSSFQKKTGILFRNEGSIQAGLHLEAQAKLSFSTGQIELFGMENFASPFNAPGIITVGPNFRVLGELKGVLSIHTDAHYQLDVVNWDYAQRYPNDNNDVESGLSLNNMEKAVGGAGLDDNKRSAFTWDVAARGDLTVTISPIVELGIIWNRKWRVQDTKIALQLNSYATLYGTAAVGSTTDANFCYGALAGCELFAQVTAPALKGSSRLTFGVSNSTLFGVNPNRRWSFYQSKKLNLGIVALLPLVPCLPRHRNRVLPRIHEPHVAGLVELALLHAGGGEGAQVAEGAADVRLVRVDVVVLAPFEEARRDQRRAAVALHRLSQDVEAVLHVELAAVAVRAVVVRVQRLAEGVDAVQSVEDVETGT
ncbi:hypothetical protein PG997_001813 [Apiospora hydei]|uniref:chitinase n=1 Tax=Apiospora hydei TaxID=1337664 RepID=A0ABR1X7M7_9PEZI